MVGVAHGDIVGLQDDDLVRRPISTQQSDYSKNLIVAQNVTSAQCAPCTTASPADEFVFSALAGIEPTALGFV